MVEWIEPLMLSGNWVPEIVALAGGRHDLTVAGQHSPYVKWEELLAYDPEVIVIVPCGFDLCADRFLLAVAGRAARLAKDQRGPSRPGLMRSTATPISTARESG